MFIKRTVTTTVALSTAALGMTAFPAAANAADAQGEGRLSATSQTQAKLVKAANPIQGRYIVMLKDGSSARGVARSADHARSLGAKVTREYKKIDGYTAKMTKAQLKKVRQDPRVAYVEQDGVVKASEEQPDATWGLDRIDQANLPLDSTYNYSTDGSGVSAYIIDTGVRTSHSEFEGRTAEGFSAVEDGKGTEDCNGHGTHVAGTVAGTTYGVAKAATVVPVRVLDCEGSGTNSGVIAGMDWVAQNANGDSVANMSLGGGASQAIDDAVANITSAGVSLAVAAGNETQDACNVSPARAPEAITVAASTDSDARADFSNYGECTDIFAPGQDITSAWMDDDSATNTISGTSMASPHVAGAAALYLSANPGSTPDQVAAGLDETATPDVITDEMGSPNKLLFTNPQ